MKPGLYTLAASLPSNPELLDKIQVALAVALSDVAQQTAALTDELKQTAAGSKVFLVDLKVLGQLLDACSVDRNLDTGTTGILGVGLGAFNSGLFFLTCNHVHVFYQMEHFRTRGGCNLARQDDFFAGNKHSIDSSGTDIDQRFELIIPVFQVRFAYNQTEGVAIDPLAS
jgi:hypothetical protein